MYDTVLVATDGSDDATRAVEHAIGVADRHGATLHALYVIETRTGYDNAIVEPETVARELRSEGREILESVERRGADAGIDVSTTIDRGVPHEVILDYVANNDVDLVVLGVRGRSAFKTILLGSVAEAVLQSASVPVILVGDPDEKNPSTGDLDE